MSILNSFSSDSIIDLKSTIISYKVCACNYIITQWSAELKLLIIAESKTEFNKTALAS